MMSDNKDIVKKRLVGVMAKVARDITNETSASGWPPVCMGILYQPKRPVKINKTSNKEIA